MVNRQVIPSFHLDFLTSIVYKILRHVCGRLCANNNISCTFISLYQKFVNTWPFFFNLGTWILCSLGVGHHVTLLLIFVPDSEKSQHWLLVMVRTTSHKIQGLFKAKRTFTRTKFKLKNRNTLSTSSYTQLFDVFSHSLRI